MRHYLRPAIASLALLISAWALAWDDPGLVTYFDPGQQTSATTGPSQGMTFVEEMRDLKQALVREREARSHQAPAVLTIEEEMRDLRRILVRERAAQLRQESVALTAEEEMRDLRAAARARYERQGNLLLRYSSANDESNGF